MITPIIQEIMPNIYPIVGYHNGYHNTARLKTFDEAWNFFNGFRNGVAGTTGTSGPGAYCNGNISNFDDVYFFNFINLVHPASNYNTNFARVNLQATGRIFF